MILLNQTKQHMSLFYKVQRLFWHHFRCLLGATIYSRYQVSCVDPGSVYLYTDSGCNSKPVLIPTPVCLDYSPFNFIALVFRQSTLFIQSAIYDWRCLKLKESSNPLTGLICSACVNLETILVETFGDSKFSIRDNEVNFMNTFHSHGQHDKWWAKFNNFTIHTRPIARFDNIQ